MAEAPTKVPAASSARTGPPADRKGRPATAAQTLGVNEGVGIPLVWMRQGRVGPAQELSLLRADAQALADLGAHTVRANTATYPWLSFDAFQREGGSWQRADNWVRTVTDAGLEPLVMLGPWPGNRTGAATEHYLPTDLDAYGAWVSKVVERYDGDGVDDMPGLSHPVKAWEVDNEPDLHSSAPPKGTASGQAPQGFETAAEYAQVLVATGAAIRRADPQAVVLSAGFYRPHTAPGRAYIQQVLAQPGAAQAFDVLSLHCYFDQDSLDIVQRTLDTWQAVAPDKGLWITETSVAAAGPRAAVDEQGQGRLVAGIIGGFLAGGADRVLWHTLADPPSNARPGGRPAPFATNSLLRSTGDDGPLEDKPAGAVYRRLSAHLAQVDPETLVEVPAQGGRLLKAGDGWLAFWGQPALPDGAGAVEDLLTGQPVQGGATVQAPAWISPAAP